MILIDSDVLILFTRGHEGARTRLAQINPWRKSVSTYMELTQGCQSKTELQCLKRSLTLRHAETLSLTPSISDRAMGPVDKHALSDGLRLADAMIAATSIEHTLTFLTDKARHR